MCMCIYTYILYIILVGTKYTEVRLYCRQGSNNNILDPLFTYDTY